MRNRYNRLSLVLVVGVGIWQGLDAGETRYRLVALEGLETGAPTYASALNDQGQAVGRSGNHACLWTAALQVIDLGTLGNDYSSAQDINEEGQVVGVSWNFGRRTRAFSWQDLNGSGQADPGEMQELQPLPGFPNSNAYAVNDHGQTVGASGNETWNLSRATLWHPDGEVRDLGTVLDSSSAGDINNHGVVVGTSQDPGNIVAWIWDESEGMRPVAGLEGPRSIVNALNDHLQIAGRQDATAFLWEEGQIRDLHDEIVPLRSVGDEAHPQAINEAGQVVGSINYESEPGGRESAGFLWDEELGFVLIDDLTPIGATRVGYAADINNLGVIAGGYVHYNQRHAFLLIPKTAVGEGFLRGDADGTGATDLSDAISTLGWLFHGESAPACLDAADANDSGVVDIADAVTTIRFLFMGDAPPPEPGPFECGPDPTLDDLTCALFLSCPQ